MPITRGMGSNSIRSQSGQAIIEYLLVLFVSLTIIGGGIYQLNTAFRVWADNYFGEYFACLLETGELPTLGGEPGAGAICDESFEEFSLSRGRPLIPGTGIGEGRSRGDQNNPRAGQVSTGSADEDSAGGNRISAGAARSGGRVTRFASSSPNRGATLGGTEAGQSREEDNYTGSTRAGLPGGVSGTGGSTEARMISGLTGYVDAGEEQKIEREKPIAAPKKGEGGVTRDARDQKFKAESPKPKPPQEDSGFKLFSIGDWLRYIFIFGILIALFLFLGGQILQISKSMK